MTPERETAQAKRQAATQVAQHTYIISSRIAAPMQGIALGTSPSRTCPDDALARMILLHYFPQGLVVAKRIEVMLIQPALAAMVKTVIGCCLAKVALDGRNALLHQPLNLRLVPTDGLRIREVEDGIFYGHAASGIHHVQTPFDNLWEEAVLGREVRQLPQTSMETVHRQLFQHADRIGETVLRKLIVALPIDAKPTRIEMDDVARNLVGAQLTGNLQSLLLREIGNATHPRAKAPQRQHRTLSRDVRIFVQNVLRLAKEHEEVHLFVGHKQALGADIRGSEVAGDGCRRVHKDAIAAIREVERHGLILSVGLRTLRVGHAQVHLLTNLI